MERSETEDEKINGKQQKLFSSKNLKKDLISQMKII